MSGIPPSAHRIETCRIIVVDDHPIQLDGIVSQILREYPQWEVVKTQNEAETMAAIRERSGQTPELISVDLGLRTDPFGYSEGLRLLQRIKREFGGIPLLAHSSQNVQPVIIRQILSIPASYVRIGPDEPSSTMYVELLRFISQNYLVLSPSVCTRVPEAITNLPDPLKPHQWDTIRRIAEGRTYEQIAQEDNVQVESVHSRVRAIVEILVSLGYMPRPNGDDPQHNKNAVSEFYRHRAAAWNR